VGNGEVLNPKFEHRNSKRSLWHGSAFTDFGFSVFLSDFVIRISNFGTKELPELPLLIRSRLICEMATVAEQLRNAREEKKLTVHQVGDITKIRTDHIRALEEGNFDVFVAPVYIKGFVRTYAALLKLNVPEVMAALDKELSQTEKFAEPPRLSEQPKGILDWVMLQLSQVNWRIASVVLGALVLVGGVYLIVSAARKAKADPLKGLPPAVYRPTNSNSGLRIPLTNPPARSR
jgi:hypothetical protein